MESKLYTLLIWAKGIHSTNKYEVHLCLEGEHMTSLRYYATLQQQIWQPQMTAQLQTPAQECVGCSVSLQAKIRGDLQRR